MYRIIDAGEHTERMYAGVPVRLIGEIRNDSPFVEVEPLEKRCPLVGNLFVRKDCLKKIG